MGTLGEWMGRKGSGFDANNGYGHGHGMMNDGRQWEGQGRNNHMKEWHDMIWENWQ